MRARLRAPLGTPDQASSGERSEPSQVNSRGISPWFTKLGDVSVRAMVHLRVQDRSRTARVNALARCRSRWPFEWWPRRQGLYGRCVPEIHAEPYLCLAGLTHKAALITWGGFYFRVRGREGDAHKLVDDSDLDHI